MIKLLHVTQVISAGWCAECLLGGAWRVNGYWASFLVIKQVGYGTDHLSPSSTKIEDRLQP
jgi:hypothetical protein